MKLPRSLSRSRVRARSFSSNLDNLLHDPARPSIQVEIYSQEDITSESAFAAAAENARQRVQRREVRRMERDALVRRRVRSGSTVRAGGSEDRSGNGSTSRRGKEEQNPLRTERLRSRTSSLEAQKSDAKRKSRSEKQRMREAYNNKPLPVVPPPYSPESPSLPERDHSLPWLPRAQKHLSDPDAQQAARISDLFSDFEPGSETVVEVESVRARSLHRKQGVAGLREQARAGGSRDSTSTIAAPHGADWSRKVVLKGHSVDREDVDDAAVARARVEHIEAWRNANALYEAERRRAKKNEAAEELIQWRIGDLDQHQTTKWEQPHMYRAEPWMGGASSSVTSSDTERTGGGDDGERQRSRMTDRTVRGRRREHDRTPRPRVLHKNVQNLPSPPSTPSTAQRPTLSSLPSRTSYQSDRSDYLVVQLEDLQRSVSAARAHNDAGWVLKMYTGGLTRALELGLPLAEAQEQAMAATAYEVQEACARALAARS